MVPIGDIETTSVHLGRSIVEIQEEETIGRKFCTVGAIGRWCYILGSPYAGTDTGDA